MRNFLVFILLSLILFNCKNRARIDDTALNDYLQKTDSLNLVLTNNYNKLLSGIYNITEDSLLADSISKLVITPDTLGFYEYLQYCINELEDIYYVTQQEIYFAQDQLNGLKEEVEKKQISDIQYEFQMESHREMIVLATDLVDSNINRIIKMSEVLHVELEDTTQYE